MAKKTITLTTMRTQQATLAEPRPVRRLRVTPTVKFGRRRYYLDNRLPVPTWARRFDGWSVRAVAGLAVTALAAGAIGIWQLLRLLGRTAR